MKIRHRIASMVIMTLVAILAIGGYAITESRGNAQHVESVTDGVIPTTLASADLVSRAKDIQLNIMALVSAPDAEIASQLKEKLAAQKTAQAEALQRQLEAATDDTQRGLVIQAQESLENYFASIEDTAQLKLAGQAALAEANLFATVAEYQREFGQIIDTLRIEKDRSKDAAIAALRHSLSRTVGALSGVTAAALLLLSFAGGLLYRQVIRPIGHMQAE